jgi:uncharacterized protein CbrC (UPF0167 family)
VKLPEFRYHPDPLATGNVKPSKAVCRCCDQTREYIYAGPVYAIEDLDDEICPWCIADGSAAEKFDATFADGHPLAEAGLSDDIIEEVTRRTPGYTSWQQEVWLACCNDACEFHGDAPSVEVRALDGDDLDELLRALEWSPTDWPDVARGYEPGGDPAIYKFICRHCGRHHYGLDYS